jgi:DNA-binding beta-propeller fold protein YncE
MSAQFKAAVGICFSPDGSFALIAESFGQVIRKIILSTAAVTTFAGGVYGTANFRYPSSVSISSDGMFALVSHRIRHITLSTRLVTVLAGQSESYGSMNGVGTSATFNRPDGVVVSPNGTYALVADTRNHLIRRINLSTTFVSLIAGTDVIAQQGGSSDGIGSKE